MTKGRVIERQNRERGMSDVMMRCNFCAGSTGGCNGQCNRYTRPYQPGFAEVVQKGCICPPTAEKTCQRWDCGRKSASNVAVGGNFVGKLADANSKKPTP
jgi:hypothetical protein